MKTPYPGQRFSSLSVPSWPDAPSNATPKQITYFPRPIGFEDIDKSVYEWFNSKGLVIDGDPVPVFFLTPEKWAEFKDRWKYMDDRDEASFPFVTIRRSSFSMAGSPVRGRIPQPRLFKTMSIPIYRNGGPTYRYYKIPQPIKVDISYEIRVLTHYIADINILNQRLIKHFASIQAYLNIDGHYMPMVIENIGDESTDQDPESERILQTVYGVKVQGYIIDEEEFEVIDGAVAVVVNVIEESNA